MSDQDAIESFLDKWRARWPEWAVVEVFVPHSQRGIALAWAALLQELTDAAWGGSDARPGEAKLGWWMEEVQGWPRGMRRHPLGFVLQKQAAPWAELASALPALRDSRERPLDAREARAQLAPLARAIAAIELVLFGDGLVEGHTDVDAGKSGASDAAIVALLHLRLAHHAETATPLHVLAQGEGPTATARWAREIAALRPSLRACARPRRLWTGLALARLQRGEPARPSSALRSLWTAWRAARG